MYTTVEAHLDNGAITLKEAHKLPKHALVLLTILKAEDDITPRGISLFDIDAKTAGVMHEKHPTPSSHQRRCVISQFL